jgi:hypothetical protein
VSRISMSGATSQLPYTPFVTPPQLAVYSIPGSLAPAVGPEGHERGHSSLTSVKDKNEWSYTSAALYAFMLNVEKFKLFTIYYLQAKR